MNIRTLVATTLMIAGATAANAADLGRGGYKDGDVVAAYDTKGSWTGPTVSVGAGVSILGAGIDYSDTAFAVVGSRDYLVQFTASYDYQFPSSALVVGAYGDVTYVKSVDEVGFGAGAKVGAAIGNAKPFVLVGYEWMNSESGLAYGGGVDFAITRNWIAGVEWKRIDWGSFGPVDVKEDRGLVRIGYKF